MRKSGEGELLRRSACAPRVGSTAAGVEGMGVAVRSVTARIAFSRPWSRTGTELGGRSSGSGHRACQEDNAHRRLVRVFGCLRGRWLIHDNEPGSRSSGSSNAWMDPRG